jgi:hypothetical protein
VSEANALCAQVGRSITLEVQVLPNSVIRGRSSQSRRRSVAENLQDEDYMVRAHARTNTHTHTHTHTHPHRS